MESCASTEQPCVLSESLIPEPDLMQAQPNTCDAAEPGFQHFSFSCDGEVSDIGFTGNLTFASEPQGPSPSKLPAAKQPCEFEVMGLGINGDQPG